MTQVRVAHVVHGLVAGGAERILLSVLESVDRDRFDSLIVCLDELGSLAPEASDLGFEPIVLGRSSRRDVGVVLRLARLFAHERVSIAQGWLPLPAAVARAAAVTARVPVRIYYEAASEPTPDPHRARRNARLERLLAPFTDGYIANSEAVAAALRDGLRADPAKITVIPNGIAVPEPIDREERERLRAELGAKPGDRLVGMVARLDLHYKDHPTFLRAVALLAAEGRPIRAAVVGEGSGRDELERLAAELGIVDRVEFTGFRRDGARLAQALDVAVLLSHSEGFSQVVLETMAAGVPLVATAIPPNREAVEDGVHGLLAPPGDAPAAAAAVGRLLDDPELASRLGAAAQARATDRYSPASQADATMGLYDRLLVSRRAAP
jgi:glycosyltransferase involved in cell wall biosynthesis